MRPETKYKRHASRPGEPISEILILPDGRIFVHNLSPAMAGLLAEFNPADEAMNRRAKRTNTLNHGFPN
jgi:hypothetical protein